jgi:hypothetical protein
VELAFSIFKENNNLRKRQLPNSKIRVLVEDLNFVLRYIHKLATPDETRCFLVRKLVKFEDYILIPNNELIPLFMRRFLEIGLRTMAEKSGNSLMKYFDEFMMNFSNIPNKSDLQFHPIVHGLANKAKAMANRLRTISQDKNLDLIDAMNDMRLDEPDKLVESVRNSSVQIAHLNKIFNHSFSYLTILNDNNYPNLVGSLYSLEISNIEEPLQSYYISNLTSFLDKLDPIKGGY